MTAPKTVTKFPHIVRTGSTSAKVYRTPVKRGRTRYPAYTVVHHFAGERVRRKFHRLEEALQAAKSTTEEINRGTMGRRVLTAAETADFLSAEEALAGTGVGLVAAAREYAEAKRDLAGVHLVRAVQFFKRYAGDTLVAVTVPEAVRQFLAQKVAQGVGEYHQHDLKTRLDRFAEEFPGQLADVSSSTINAWLAGLKLEARTQNNYRAALVQLFNFARSTLKALPHWLPHAAEEAIKVKEPAKDTEIYTPAEMQLILAAVSPQLAPLIALRAFSGIRNEETWALDWAEIDLERSVIVLKSSVTKLAQRRVMPLLPNLKAWLQRVNRREGRVAAGYVSAKTMSEAISNAVDDAGVAIKRNALRNSYTSYRLAVLGEVGKVAEETGNSPAVIKREYLELVTTDKAAEWFAIVPKSNGAGG